MRVAAEALEKPRKLLMHHRMAGDAMHPVGTLRRGRQFTVKQKIGGFEEVALFGELFDRIAAIQQNALVTVDIGNLGFAARRRGEAGIVGEHSRLRNKAC